MALLKEIELPNGIVLRYHRVCRVDSMTNSQTLIEVASYISQAKREEEKVALATHAPMDVYIHGEFYNAPWSEEGMSTTAAYDWLKANVPEFEGAEDILES